MGSKIPVKGSSKTTVYKCPQCPRSLATLAALKSHFLFNHSKERPKAIAKLKSIRRANRLRNNIISHPKQVLKKNAKINGISENTDAESVQKILFECPICKKCYSTHSGLRKHKKTHFIKDDGTANSDSSQECEPGEETPCACPKSIDKCATMACGECSRQFSNYRELLKHIDLVHREDLISIFFPNEQEFLMWKSEMEFTTKSDFRQRQSVDYRELYVCTAHIHSGDDTCFVQCPAMLAKRLFEKGVQVFFHKNHNGHKFIDYVPDVAIEKYLVKNIARSKREAAQVKSDLYNDFKSLMDYIIKESAKLNNDKLKLLIPRAEEMTTLLPSKAADFSTKRKVEDTVQVKNDDDNRPVKRIKDEKRQKESSQQLLVARKSRSVSLKERDAHCNSSPMIVNTFTLANTDVKLDSKDDTPVEVDASTAASEPQSTKEEPKHEVEAKSEPDSPDDNAKDPLGKIAAKVSFDNLLTKSSFNDSYKDFIEQTTGQKTASTQLAPVSPKSFYSNKKKKENGDKVLVDSNNLERLEPSQIEYNDLSKLFGGPNKNKQRPRKKDKVKTKLGQFSPKKQSPNWINHITKEDDQNSSFGSLDSSFNTTKFQEYEVQERENDCNILILKF